MKKNNEISIDASFAYQYSFSIFEDDYEADDETKYSRAFSGVKQKFPESIIQGECSDDIFDHLEIVENFLHGGKVPFRFKRMRIKGLDLRFRKDAAISAADIEESGILITMFPEFNTVQLMFSFKAKNITPDELIFMRQNFDGAGLFASEKYGEHSVTDWQKIVVNAMNCGCKYPEKTYLLEIFRFAPYDNLDDILTNEPQRIYGMLCGDEGWEFVPEDMAEERISKSWGSRDFVKFIVCGNNSVLFHLVGSESWHRYQQRQNEFGTKAYNGVNEYFTRISDVAGINQGILISQEFVNAIRAKCNSIINMPRRIKRSGIGVLGKEIYRTKRLRSDLITTLNKVEDLRISEIGELEQLLMTGYKINPLIDNIKYTLELTESELDLLYQESTNNLVNILTVAGLLISVISMFV